MKGILENLASFAVGITFAIVILWILDINWERRFTLYHIRNELKVEMSKVEVGEIIDRHQTSFITKRESEEEINLRVNLGGADSLSLILGFSGNKLKSAILIGEDHPLDVPADAPLNLE